jgi:hypothetical protein
LHTFYNKGGRGLKEVLKDEHFRKLLREKNKYELFSWFIPLISILSLIIILFLTSKSHLNEFTIFILVLLILLIIFGYVFDNKITIKIQETHANLNEYFQNEIVPKLIKVNNKSINFYNDRKIAEALIDEVQLFNNYTEYKSQYNYSGLFNNKEYCFNEVLFNNIVNHDTTGKKVYNDMIKKKLNYHWYTFELNKKYPQQALYLVAKFECFNSKLLTNFTRCDHNDIELYLNDINDHNMFLAPGIIELLQDERLSSMVMAIYLNGKMLNIIIEEQDDLIDLNHSNKIIVDSLLADYYNEQELIKKIVLTYDG